MKKPRLVVLLAILTVCFACCGCGLFDTRNPEPPGGGGPAWIPPTEPETLFVDIKNSMEGKVIANFERCFVDTGFAFHPDPADSLDLLSQLQRDVFFGWDLPTEFSVAQRIFDEANTIRLTLTSRDAPVTISTDERIYFFKYELQILYKVGSASTFWGYADFDVKSVGGLWYVSMWLDKRDPDHLPGADGPFTWGYLKGTKR